MPRPVKSTGQPYGQLYLSRTPDKTRTPLTNKKLSPHVKGGMKSFGVGVGINAAMGVLTGQGIGSAVGQGLLYEGFLNTAAPGIFWGQMGFELAKAGTSAYFDVKNNMRDVRRAALDPSNMNFNYMDTQQAYTMRQAAVQAIQGSHLNARSALGGEARLMHRGNPTY